MRRSNHQGTMLITLIIAIMMIGVLGAGIYSLTTTSTFTGLLSNKNDQAYQLAQAGVRYAIDKIIQSNPNYSSTDYFLPDNNHKFNITVVNNVITSVGIVNAGTFLESRRQIIYNVSNSWSSGGTIPLPAPQEPVISLPNDTAAFTPTQSTTGAITVSADGTITLGGDVNRNSGTILYQGSSSVSNCNDGVCNFPYGLRAYFEFTGPEDHGNPSYGDGFTFGVFSAINNTRDRSGGAPTSVNMGELGGYAGADNMPDQLGLIPPKIAVEFDTYANTGVMSNNGCSGGRKDAANNHIALMFWGKNLADNCATGSTAAGFAQASFDDNIHGAGDGTTTNPYNSATSGTGSGLGGYYEGTKDLANTNCSSSPATICNWMEDGHTYGFRMEIIRHTSGTSGLYQVKAWIYRLNLSGAPTGTQLTHFRDVQNPYTPYATSGPHINRIVTLDQAYNDALQKVYFGFTEATGDSNQNIKLNNLNVFFPQTEDGTCIYNINPLSPNPASFSASAGSGTFSVEAVSGCSWSASTASSWIHTTSTGTGGGTGSYTVDANTGTQRSGTILVTGGQSLPVTQLCPLLSITAASLPNGRINDAYTSTTVTASGGVTPYSWSQSGLPAGLNINTSTGVISGTPTATGLYTPTVTVTDICPQTANSTFNLRIKPTPYSIMNSVGANIYRMVGTTCTNANRLTSGSTYSIAYNAAAAVTFYQNRNASNACLGSSISISGANADAADADYDASVQINSSWSLVDR